MAGGQTLGARDLLGIARAQRARLARLPATFDLALLEEGRTLADEISAGGSRAPGAKTSPDVDLRDRLVSLAERRVRKVRAAARLVYRAHPGIARQAASAYRREARARAAAAKAAPTPTPTPPTPTRTTMLAQLPPDRRGPQNCAQSSCRGNPPGSPCRRRRLHRPSKRRPWRTRSQTRWR